MVRLVFASTPRKVVVRLGRGSALGTARSRCAVACAWHSRLHTRPRQLRLATRRPATEPTAPTSKDHGRIIYA
jgi:hypothetical protein